MIVSAWPMNDGIQINRQIDANTVDCRMVYPGDDDWQEAVAAAEKFATEVVEGEEEQ